MFLSAIEVIKHTLASLLMPQLLSFLTF